MAPRALPDSRLAATVHLHQRGYAGQKVKVNIREGKKLLASQEITLKADGVEQVEPVLFSAGPAGVKTIQAYVDPLPNEENPAQQFGDATGQRRRPQAPDSVF